MSKYPDDWSQRRKHIYKRDGYQCQRCGAKGGPYGNTELHAHHRVPVSKGGSHDVRNLVTVCKSCHEQIHGHRIPTNNTVPSDDGDEHTKRTGKYWWIIPLIGIIILVLPMGTPELGFAVIVLGLISPVIDWLHEGTDE